MLQAEQCCDQCIDSTNSFKPVDMSLNYNNSPVMPPLPSPNILPPLFSSINTPQQLLQYIMKLDQQNNGDAANNNQNDTSEIESPPATSSTVPHNMRSLNDVAATTRRSRDNSASSSENGLNTILNSDKPSTITRSSDVVIEDEVC